ncbi:fungal-specific transcription factor domain-containing protein [Aspergillus keveii]|uniref:Fungal-specific transcription factor domain-containing protein n=1 Tax=Aspergillus keveii TaxID=714993 RepID=A0ABR4FIZ0_9EURO
MSAAKRKSVPEVHDKLREGARKRTTRNRAALACEECRSRKRRCDGAIPACGGCVKRMSVCVYASEIHAKAWRDSMIQSLRTRLEELEKGDDLGGEPERELSDPHLLLPDSNVEAEQHGDAAEAPAAISPASQPQPPPESGITQSEPPVHIRPKAIPPNSYPPRGLEPCSVERLMRPIAQAIDSRGGHYGISTGPTWLSHAAPAGLGRERQTNCSCDRILSASKWRLPLRRHADDLLVLYFSRVHRMYPILHERTFRRQYESLWQSATRPSTDLALSCSGLCKQKSQGKTFAAMVHAILAFASLFESGTLEQNTQQADNYFEMAQEINLLEILDYEVGVELVQLGLLMGFYLQSTERFSKCWNITGLTIRMAQNMGLQLGLDEARRKGLFAPHATQLDCEMRIRVWHGCVLLDREISMSFGRPLMIKTGGEGVEMPEAIDDNRLSEKLGSRNVQPTDHPSLLESYIQTIRLYDILKQVLDREELREASSNSPDICSLLHLDSSIMEWRDALPSYLQYDPASDATITGSQHSDFSAQAKRLYIRFLHVRVLILRPALDLLFQKRQQKPLGKDRHMMDARAQDLVLKDLGTQCALSAHSLVKLLGGQVQSKSLVAWWYNISYLHTCGSTLLMARVCILKDMAISGDLFRSWELCLQCISRYTSVSSIARKSVRLLKESAKCLISEDTVSRTSSDDDLPAMTSVRGILNGGPRAGLQTSPQFTAVIDPDLVFAQDGTQAEPQLPRNTGPDPMVDLPHLDGPEGNLWANDVGIGSYWPFMPFLSQLETLPAEFDLSNLD